MYYIKKTLEISAAHKLNLNYESKCENVHGHNWIVTIHCSSATLDENGMVYDFTKLKKLIMNRLDHKYINDVIDVNPTAENMAKWIADEIGETCYRVDVQESSGNMATYEKI